MAPAQPLPQRDQSDDDVLALRPHLDLEAIVARLRATRRLSEREARGEHAGRRSLPSRPALLGLTEQLRAILFPAHFGAPAELDDGVDAFVRATLTTTLPALAEQVRRALHFACPVSTASCPSCDQRVDAIVAAFLEQLPELRAVLGTDVRAAYEGDPAASSVDEALFCYPGVAAIIHHRLAHALHALGVPLIPRIVAEISHGATGIDIHPAASIGASFFIDHGTGVVIGETTRIGARVRLYQGVTLGARSFPVDEAGQVRKGIPRHPIIEDDVVIYAGATILGRVRIGRGSTIGGNVWLTRDVPPRSRITQALARNESFENGSGI
jgi:serine O-acetyltransferase